MGLPRFVMTAARRRVIDELLRGAPPITAEQLAELRRRYSDGTREG